MKLLVAIDFSDPTDLILRVAERLAKSLDASVWVVHAAEPEPDFVGYDAGPEVVRGQVAKELREEHRDLDEAIARMAGDPRVDQLRLTRMKKRKLKLKDWIAQLESELIPDIDA